MFCPVFTIKLVKSYINDENDCKILRLVWSLLSLKVMVSLCGCFTAPRHILGHFWRDQLLVTYPYCSWASLLGSLQVLSAHSFASNWQLPFLNQRKEENGRRNYFMTKLHERMWQATALLESAEGIEIISWPNFTKECCRTWGSNPHTRRTRIRPSYHDRLSLKVMVTHQSTPPTSLCMGP